MNVLIVYGSQFGNTFRLARAMEAALAPMHDVRIVDARETRGLLAPGVDLLIVGAPTQMHGLRLIVRSFLDALGPNGFGGVPAAAFDTRLAGPKDQTGAESEVIAAHLREAGCQLLTPPESFLVMAIQGPLAVGEEDRAARWAVEVSESVASAPQPG